MSAYTSQMVERARAHHACKWSVEDIRRLLQREFGQQPSWHTVKRWIDPKFAEKARAATNNYRLGYIARDHGPGRPNVRMSPQLRDARMLALYRRGVSLKAIGQVAAIWWGEELTQAQVKARLGLKSGSVIASRRALEGRA